MSCSRVSRLASTNVGELRLLQNDGFAKFVGPLQKSALCGYCLCFSTSFGLPKLLSRGWAKEMGKGGWFWKQPSPPQWECVAEEVLRLARRRLAEAERDGEVTDPLVGTRVPRTLSHHHRCQTIPEARCCPGTKQMCGGARRGTGNAATERCARRGNGNEAQERHVDGMGGEFTQGQSPSPFIFGRFG